MKTQRKKDKEREGKRSKFKNEKERKKEIVTSE
jgi:hypothetical protein